MRPFISKTLPLLAPVVVRVGVSLVYLWFGFQQLIHTSQWTSLVPDWVLSFVPVNASSLVHVNGSFEIVFGFALLIGIFVRMNALLLALHMAHITLIVGYSSIGVRDFGLVMATLSVCLSGPDSASMERYLFSWSEPAAEESHGGAPGVRIQ